MKIFILLACFSACAVETNRVQIIEMTSTNAIINITGANKKHEFFRLVEVTNSVSTINVKHRSELTPMNLTIPK